MTDTAKATIEQDLSELRRTAAAATHKPWELVAFDSGHSQFETCCTVATKDQGDEIVSMNALARLGNDVDAKDDGFNDAAFIAAFDPPTVTALLDELENSRTAIKAARTAIETVLEQHQAIPDGTRHRTAGTCAGCPPWTADPCSTRTSLESLLEQLGEPATS